MRLFGFIAALLLLPVVLVVGLIGLATTAPQQQQLRAAGACTVTGTVPGLTAEQQANARAIARVALELGLGARGVAVGIVTALTESTLVAVNYGDRDPRGVMTSSRGLFQQKDGWGTLAERLDPAGAATLFYTGGHGGQPGLLQVPDWQRLPIPLAAQTVQRSGFANGSNYAAHLSRGLEITAALAGACMPTGTAVTIPDSPYVATALRGLTITVPAAGLGRGLALGFAALGLPYVWGGGNPAGPDTGCARGHGTLNSCRGIVGFDCSGLTAYVIIGAGYPAPGGNSSSQRNPAHAVPWTAGLPGDIVGFPGHVAVYLGVVGGVPYILEASTVGVPVHVVPLTRRDHDPVMYRYWN